MAKTKTLIIRLESKDWERVKSIAATDSRSVASVIRQAVSKFIEEDIKKKWPNGFWFTLKRNTRKYPFNKRLKSKTFRR